MSAPVILSLGAGVQSSTLALMAARGEVGPMPVAAIFADTQAEPASVYRWLEWLEGQLPYPVIRATKGDLTADSTRLRTSRSGSTYLSPSLPVFVEEFSGRRGLTLKPGILQRQCTRDYKIDVVRRAAKKLLPRGSIATMWIGISTDEAQRMKDSRDPRFVNAWPLIDGRISRADCLRWMDAHGYPKPPRSACVYCPYHNDIEWTRLQREEPEEFARAIAYEERLTAVVRQATALRVSAAYLHSSRRPLRDVTFDVNPHHQINLFGNECEGMCGV